MPRDRRGRRIIDEERVCEAIAAISDADGVRRQAAEFALLADPTRLSLLLCIEAAGPISVSDLAAATGLADATVSQTLRHLRAADVVLATRDGRVMRYEMKPETPIAWLLSRAELLLSGG